MAGGQEVNQHNIISQPAPGGSSASHATTPLSFGTPASLGTPHTAHPAASLWAIASVLCLCQVTLAATALTRLLAAVHT